MITLGLSKQQPESYQEVQDTQIHIQYVLHDLGRL